MANVISHHSDEDVRIPFLPLFILAACLAGCSGGGGSDSPPPPDNPAPLPQLSVDDATVGEAEGTVAVIVRATGERTDEDISVSYATADVTATNGVDYMSRSGTLEFSPEQSEQIIEVDILDDDETELNERFELRLDTPQGAGIADGVGVVTIDDDDGDFRACGEPESPGGSVSEPLLWKDCEAGTWHFRAGAPAGESRSIEGVVASAEAFSDITPRNLEPADTLDTSDPARIVFSFAIAAPNEDGFSFVAADNADSCFELSVPADATVFVGSSRLAMTGSFDLATLDTAEVDCAPPPAEPGPMNVVVVFTDDQRFDTLQYMPNVNTRLKPKGVTFENAYVPTPLCCPARASTYSGGFLAQNTGVLDNEDPNGGRDRFDDRVNLGTRLQEAGYKTMFIGKWLNDYPLAVPYVPPGWDTFAGRAVWATGADWSQFEYLVGSTGPSSGTGKRMDASGQHHVYFERDRIVQFLLDNPDDEPFFVFWATTPPHPPATPADGDEVAFTDFTFRGRGYGETDLSDKSPWLQRFNGEFEFTGDEGVRLQLQSMLSVDDSIGWILDTLAARDKLDDTVLIITSDNGYMWGEHGLWGKNFAYEESIRVPLLVVMPGIEPRTDEHLVSAVLDLGPTLYDVAGVSGASDGRSLLPLLRDAGVEWRDELFFEKYGTVTWANGSWAGLRQNKWKYIQYWPGDEELYDLNADPYELENQAGNSAHAQVRTSMAARVEELVGLSIKPGFGMPDGVVGEPYEYDFATWGGRPPYDWEVETGALPEGLALEADSGTITGTPLSAGISTFSLRVTSSDLASQANRRKTFVSRELTVEVTGS